VRRQGTNGSNGKRRSSSKNIGIQLHEGLQADFAKDHFSDELHFGKDAVAADFAWFSF
jgi:hypothetical protein